MRVFGVELMSMKTISRFSQLEGTVPQTTQPPSPLSLRTTLFATFHRG